MPYYSVMEWTIKLRNAPEGLSQQVKIAAAKAGQTMEKFIIEAIREKLAKPKK